MQDDIAAPIYKFNPETLREVVEDLQEWTNYIDYLNERQTNATNTKEKVSLLSLMGIKLRSVGRLDEAEHALKKSITLANESSLGIPTEIRLKLLLAHVYQWKGEFQLSNAMFEQALVICRNGKTVQYFLDFALQHSGKNLFDQGRFKEAMIQFEEALVLRKNRNAPMDQIESTELAIRETTRRLFALFKT